MNQLIATLALAAAVTTPAFAESFYVGADVGQSRAKTDSTNKTDTTFGVLGGYRINDSVAAELGYRDYGKFDAYKAHSVTASVLGNVVASGPFSVTGRLGVTRVKASDATRSESKTKGIWGVGARYAVNKDLALRADYTQTGKIDGVKLSSLTVGAEYNF
jgi:OOP family OmpA-OmpF porin